MAVALWAAFGHLDIALTSTGNLVPISTYKLVSLSNQESGARHGLVHLARHTHQF